MATEGIYTPDTPEDAVAFNQALAEKTKKAGNSFLSLPATLASPDFHLPGLAKYLPGAGLVENFAGLGGQLVDAGSTLANAGLGALGFKTQLPYAPQVLRDAGEHFENTRSDIKDLLGKYTPLTAPDMSNPDDRFTDTLASILGGIVPIVPGAIANPVVNAVTKMLPTGLKTVGGTATHMLLPSGAGLERNIPVASALAGGETAADILSAPDQAPSADTPTKAPDIGLGSVLSQQAQPTDIGLGKVLAPQAPPADGSANIGLGSVLQGGDQPPGPTNAATGYSPMPVWRAATTFGLAIAAIAAGRYTHGTSRVITDVERTARFNDPAYAAAAADYNNERIARGGSEISPPSGAPPPPIPEQNQFRRVTNYANDKLLNSNAQMQDAIRMSAEPSDAQRLAHQYGMAHDDMAWDAKLTNFMETGRDPQTGIAVPRLTKLQQDFAGLDADRFRTINDGLHAADEQDNRRDNQNTFRNANPDVTPTIDDIRHNFKNQTDADLVDKVQRMMADPVLADMADRYHRFSSGMIDIGEGHGFFPPSEAADLKSIHPNHVAEVGPTGETKNPMQRRDKTIATGTDQVNSSAIHNLTQHVEDLYKQIHLNDMNRALRQSQMDTQRQFPGSAQFMYDVPAPTQGSPTFYSGGSFREPVVTIRHPTGPTFTRIDHPDWYNAMTGDSLRRREIGTGLLSIPRRVLQYMTTGVGSLVTGRIAPLVNVGYTGLSMGTNAPKGYYGGQVDRLVQRNLPGPVANVLSPLARGFDTVTSTPLGIGYSYLRGAGDRWVGRAANMIEQGAKNPINDTLRAYYGDQYINSWQNTIRRAYENSITNQMQQRGMGGMGIPVKTDLPTMQIAADKQARLVSAHLVPELFQSNGMFGNVKPVILKLNKVVQEAMGHISDAGHDYFARMNWDNPNTNPESLAYETRQLVGNPSTRGSSTALQKAMSIIPYGNIGIQGAARLGRSIGERPIGAPMALASAFGTLAMAEILTHMRSQQHLDYYQNELSAQQRAANVVLALSDDPHKPTLIPVAQEFRAPKAFMSEIMAKAVNVIAMQHDPDWYKSVWNGLSDFLGGHLSNTSTAAMIHGVADTLPNLPGYAGSIDWAGMMQGKNPMDTYRAPGAAHPLNLPGQVQDGPLDSKEGQTWSNIFKSVIGLAGVSIDGINNVARYAKQTGSWVDALGAAGHDWVQGMQDRNPELNMLWDHQVRLSTQAPIEEMMTRKLDALNRIIGSRSAERFEGMSGTNRYAQPVPMSTTSNVPTDPTMRAMQSIADAYKTRMAPQLADIQERKKQMASVNVQAMDPATRRTWMNQQTRAVADKYRFLNSMTSDLEHALSLQVGRPVHLEDIDMTKGPEQFQ